MYGNILERLGSRLRLGTDAASMATGIFALQGTVAALICRERRGIGQKVEVSHLGAMLALETHLNAAQSNSSLSGGWHLSAPTDPVSHSPMAKDLPIELGFLGFNARSGGGGWESFCRALGIPDEIAADPRFADRLGRVLNEEALRLILEHYFKHKTALELKKIIEDCGGRAVISNTYETLFRDPQVAAMEMLRELTHPKLGKIETIGLPWNLRKTPGSLRLPPPTLGQHTLEISSKLSRSKR